MYDIRSCEGYLDSEVFRGGMHWCTISVLSGIYHFLPDSGKRWEKDTFSQPPKSLENGKKWEKVRV